MDADVGREPAAARAADRMFGGWPRIAAISSCFLGSSWRVQSETFFERSTDLLQQVVEGSVARRRIARLDVHLDLDGMLVVRAPEAAERLREATLALCRRFYTNEA